MIKLARRVSIREARWRQLNYNIFAVGAKADVLVLWGLF